MPPKPSSTYHVYSSICVVYTEVAFWVLSSYLSCMNEAAPPRPSVNWRSCLLEGSMHQFHMTQKYSWDRKWNCGDTRWEKSTLCREIGHEILCKSIPVSFVNYEPIIRKVFELIDCLGLRATMNESTDEANPHSTVNCYNHLANFRRLRPHSTVPMFQQLVVDKTKCTKY